MTYSELTIIFDEDLTLDNQIGIIYGASLTVIKERWVNTRLGLGHVVIGTPTAIPGERSAINFTDAFQADFNAQNIFKIIRVENVVVLQFYSPKHDFEDYFSIDDYSENPPVENAKVRFIVDNYTGSFFGLDTIQFLESTTNNVCSHYKVSIETSAITDRTTGSYTLPTGNTNNPFTFEVLREQSLNLNLFGPDNQQLSINYNSNKIPSLLNENKFEFIITNSPNGATLVVNDLDTNNLNLEYSLNNIDWQTDNTFTGILDGSHTVYVRDHLGCSFSKNFTITSTSVRTPYFVMPKSNPIR